MNQSVSMGAVPPVLIAWTVILSEKYAKVSKSRNSVRRMGREQSAIVSEFRNAVDTGGGRNMKSVHHIGVGGGGGFKSMEVLLAISVITIYVVLLLMPVITVYVDGNGRLSLWSQSLLFILKEFVPVTIPVTTVYVGGRNTMTFSVHSVLIRARKMYSDWSCRTSVYTEC